MTREEEDETTEDALAEMLVLEDRAKRLVAAELAVLEEPAADVTFVGGSYREAPRVVPKPMKPTRYGRFLVRMGAIDWDAVMVVALFVVIAVLSMARLVLGGGP